MRSAVISFCVLAFFTAGFARAQVIGTVASEPHPVKLSSAHFYQEAFVTTVQDGKFDPFVYAEKRPLALHFVKPGRLEIDWGTEIVVCRIRSPGLTVRITFEALCETGTKFANWTWLSLNRAETNLFFAFAGKPQPPKETLNRLDFSFDELVAKYDAEYALKTFPHLTAIYLDKSENVLHVTPQGEVYYNDEIKPSRLKECLYLKRGTEPDKAARGACLTIDLGPGPITLVFKPGRTARRLREVSPRQDMLPTGRGFELVKDGATFKLVP